MHCAIFESDISFGKQTKTKTKQKIIEIVVSAMENNIQFHIFRGCVFQYEQCSLNTLSINSKNVQSNYYYSKNVKHLPTALTKTHFQFRNWRLIALQSTISTMNVKMNSVK